MKKESERRKSECRVAVGLILRIPSAILALRSHRFFRSLHKKSPETRHKAVYWGAREDKSLSHNFSLSPSLSFAFVCELIIRLNLQLPRGKYVTRSMANGRQLKLKLHLQLQLSNVSLPKCPLGHKRQLPLKKINFKHSIHC